MAIERSRGSKPAEQAGKFRVFKKSRTIIILVAVAFLGLGLVLAISLESEQCDLKGRTPEETALLCSLRDSESPESCPPELTQAECDQLREEFQDH